MKRTWIRNAFAVDPPGPAEPTPVQQESLDILCLGIVRRKLAMPATAALEMCRPLNFIGSQTMQFFHPMISAFVPAEGWKHVAEYLERRGSVEWIRDRIDELEAEQEKSGTNE